VSTAGPRIGSRSPSWPDPVFVLPACPPNDIRIACNFLSRAPVIAAPGGRVDQARSESAPALQRRCRGGAVLRRFRPGFRFTGPAGFESFPEHPLVALGSGEA